MKKDKQSKDELTLASIREVVELCKKHQLVRALANAMELRPQAIYAWVAPNESNGKSPVLTARSAGLRLLAISVLKQPELHEVVVYAANAIKQIDAMTE